MRTDGQSCCWDRARRREGLVERVWLRHRLPWTVCRGHRGEAEMLVEDGKILFVGAGGRWLMRARRRDLDHVRVVSASRRVFTCLLSPT